MKKLLISLILLLTFVTPAFAVVGRDNLLTARDGTVTGSSSSARQELKTQATQNKIADLQERAKQKLPEE